MALVRRDGRVYYQQSVRRGGKVTSKYVASGMFACDLHAMDRSIKDRKRIQRHVRLADARERRKANDLLRANVKSLGDRLHSQALPVVSFFDRSGAMVNRFLEAAGYHRHHRGNWRQRRGAIVSAELARARISEIVRLAREGDRMALGEVALRAPDWMLEKAVDGEGYLDDIVETCMVNRFVESREQREAVAARAALMRMELAPTGSSPIVELLATRAVVCWLHVQSLEMDLDALMGLKDTPETARKVELIDRRLSRAQSRYVQALTAIAKVKRLQLPVVFQQMNVAQTQQVVNRVAE